MYLLYKRGCFGEIVVKVICTLLFTNYKRDLTSTDYFS